MEKGIEYAQEVRDKYTSENYHQPSDEYNEGEWDLTGFIQDADLMLRIGLDLINTDKWPEWKEGSEFKNLDRRSQDDKN